MAAQPTGHVRTNLLDQQGITGAEVKRRADAGEPIVQDGLHEPSVPEALASATGSLYGGLAKGLAQVVTVPADIIGAPLRAGEAGIDALRNGSGVVDAAKAGTQAAFSMPLTHLATEAGDYVAADAKQRLGVKSGAITDTGDAMNDLAGQVVGGAASPIEHPPTPWTPTAAEAGERAVASAAEDMASVPTELAAVHSGEGINAPEPAATKSIEQMTPDEIRAHVDGLQRQLRESDVVPGVANRRVWEGEIRDTARNVASIDVDNLKPVNDHPRSPGR
jgi:hypothetical protein